MIENKTGKNSNTNKYNLKVMAEAFASIYYKLINLCKSRKRGKALSISQKDRKGIENIYLMVKNDEPKLK